MNKMFLISVFTRKASVHFEFHKEAEKASCRVFLMFDIENESLQKFDVLNTFRLLIESE